MRWSEDYYLFVLGTLSFGSASIGRTAASTMARLGYYAHHGMGLSYIVLLTAFYVDNGKNLLLWKEFPHVAYWVLPSAVGISFIAQALIRYRELNRRLPVV